MFFLRWIEVIRERSKQRKIAHNLYFTTVNQSRNPKFFQELGIPDTLDGRFDLMILHVGLVLRRLRSAENETTLSDALFSVMFDDLDQTVREMGVGDIRVGKKVKAMARAFYGRCKVYDQALDDNDLNGLIDALRRNIYGQVSVNEEHLGILGNYVVEVSSQLSLQRDNNLLSGEVIFPNISLTFPGNS